jgi:hypothetical protein
MDLNPPAGSQITINHDNVDPTISIPAANNPWRYLGGLFLLFWLGAWVFGFKSASTQVMEGKGGFFLIFWLAGWTVGGILAALTAFRLFRPTAPETLQLKRSSVEYDSGIAPLEFTMQRGIGSQQKYWKSLFAKRTRASLDRQQLQTLRLRETENGNRLTIDLGAQRLELASQASEVEREWLARLLARRYSIQVSPANPAAEG